MTTPPLCQWFRPIAGQASTIGDSVSRNSAQTSMIPDIRHNFPTT